MNYYNEFDPHAAAWLRELITQKLIPNGHVDTRSIAEVSPSDLDGYVQCHFFAGIAGWSLALQLAGWPEDRPVWTGSCPCQPFSTAGKGLGTADERHLWPVFAELIRAYKPPTVFGEQVASKAGREWLSGVFADLEGMGYQRAGADLCAAGVGAPHIRQRVYWVANANDTGLQGWKQCDRRSSKFAARSSVPFGGLGDSECRQHERRGGVGDLGCPSDQEQGEASERQRSGDADCGAGSDDHRLVLPDSDGRQSGRSPATPAGHGDSANPASFWSDSQLAHCRDGKARRIPTEPAFQPLAPRVPARVVRLRGYGNAINIYVAKSFIEAYLDLA